MLVLRMTVGLLPIVVLVRKISLKGPLHDESHRLHLRFGLCSRPFRSVCACAGPAGSAVLDLLVAHGGPWFQLGQGEWLGEWFRRRRYEPLLEHLLRHRPVLRNGPHLRQHVFERCLGRPRDGESVLQLPGKPGVANVQHARSDNCFLEWDLLSVRR